jgi:phage gpG-like protein
MPYRVHGSARYMKYLKDDKREQKRLAKIIQKMAKAPHVAVGILQDKPISEGFTMVDLATVHEYGSKNGHTPQRSFMRSTCDAKQGDHIKLAGLLQNKIIDDKLSIKQALTQLGEVVEKDMVQTINRGIRPMLKPATIKRKGSSKPLINTGHLKGFIKHEVRGVS